MKIDRETLSGGRSRPTLEELKRHHTCSIDVAAAALGIGRSTAYSAAHDGSLPVLRVRNRLLVPTAKLIAMLADESTHEQSRCAACAHGDGCRDDD